jgi:mevalonate kinase
LQEFWVPGKLLLTGEYLVLRGAEALSVPTRFGQYLALKPPKPNCFLFWEAFSHNGAKWLEVSFNQQLEITYSSHPKKALVLQKLLQQAQALGANFGHPAKVQTKLEFSRNWGLGSSSTLVALIAKWLNVPALPLFFNALSGSGYDVATALENKPILYKLEDPEKASWQKVQMPAVVSQSKFVYLGKKQDSAAAVANFKSIAVSSKQVADLSALSHQLLRCQSIKELAQILETHEELTAGILKQKPLKEKLFSDFKGAIKSLGAWGGDFAWVVEEELQPNYFKNKGVKIERTFEEMCGKIN